MGFCGAFGILLIIFVPILLFSGLNPGMVSNPVLEAEMMLSFELGTLEYNVYASQGFNIGDLSGEERDAFRDTYMVMDPEFDLSLMQQVKFTSYSEKNWAISDPSLAKLQNDFTGEGFVTFKLKWDFERSLPIDAKLATGQTIATVAYEDFQVIMDLMAGTEGEASVTLARLMPQMLRLS